MFDAVKMEVEALRQQAVLHRQELEMQKGESEERTHGLVKEAVEATEQEL